MVQPCILQPCVTFHTSDVVLSGPIRVKFNSGRSVSLGTFTQLQNKYAIIKPPASGWPGVMTNQGEYALPGDEASEHPTQSLNTQGQGGDIQQQQVSHITLHDTSLNGSARGHHLIRVHPARGLLLEQVLHDAAHLYSQTGSCQMSVNTCSKSLIASGPQLTGLPLYAYPECQSTYCKDMIAQVSLKSSNAPACIMNSLNRI